MSAGANSFRYRKMRKKFWHLHWRLGEPQAGRRVQFQQALRPGICVRETGANRGFNRRTDGEPDKLVRVQSQGRPILFFSSHDVTLLLPNHQHNIQGKFQSQLIGPYDAQ